TTRTVRTPLAGSTDAPAKSSGRAATTAPSSASCADDTVAPSTAGAAAAAPDGPVAALTAATTAAATTTLNARARFMNSPVPDRLTSTAAGQSRGRMTSGLTNSSRAVLWIRCHDPG